jgi:uncharacterized protein YhaN
MFSLDDDTLQSGGESILQSEGDLGRLLFSATSGLSELSRQLDAIKEEADLFHRPGGRATELRQLKDGLEDLKDQQAGLDTNALRYAELHQLAKAARAAYESAKTERDRTRVRHDRVRRLLDALPMWAHLKDLRLKMEPLRELPDPPAGWTEEARQLSQDEASKKAGITGADEDLARLTGELDGLVVDEKILAVSAQIDRLNDDEGRYRSAIDIPARESERQGVQAQVAELIKNLGCSAAEDPRALPLPAATTGALSDLIETRSGLLALGNAARREADAARDRVELARKTVEDLDAAVDVSGLEAILNRLRSQETGARLGEVRRRQAEVASEIEAELAGLRPWQGDSEALALATPPGRGRIERWKSDLSLVREEQAALCRKQAERAEVRDRLLAETAAVKESAGAIDDAEAAVSRADRDRAWQAHRSLLDGATSDGGPIDGGDLRSTADAFETALAGDDRLVERRERQSAEIARLRQAKEGIARTEASLAHGKQRLESLAAQRGALIEEVTEALVPIGLPGEMEPADLERWLERRDEILKKRAEIGRASCRKRV